VRCSAAGGSTGRRRTCCCRRCATVPSSSATRPSSCRSTPTTRRCSRSVTCRCRSSSRRPTPRPLRALARLRGGAGGARLRHHRGGVLGLGQRPQALLMEDFYRWQRVRFGLLMDGDEPAGGRGTSTTTTASRRPSGDARPRGALAAGRGRRRRAGPRGPRPVGARRAGRLRRRRRPRWAPATRWEALARSTTSSRTASPTSARPRTRCSAPTRGWPTAPCRRPSTSDCCTRSRSSTPRSRPTGRAGRRSTASRATSARSSAGGSTSGRCTGTSPRTTATATPCRRRPTCRSGSAPSTPASR
jgi:hypothetical protein